MGPLVALLFLTEVSVGELGLPADRFAPHRGMNTEIWVDWLSLQEMLATPGFLDVYPDYPRYLPEGRLKGLVDEGFDFVRIAVDPSPMLALAGSPRQDLLVAQVRARVDEAQAAGLKVILDLHSIPSGQDFDNDWALASDENFAAYAAMAARVAAALDGLPPDRTALQLMNEPTSDCEVPLDEPEQATWPGRLKLLHDAARAAAPELPLVLSGACWGGSWPLAFIDPAAIGDDNVLWSVHSYDPFLFSHQGASWTGDAVLPWLRDLPYPPDALSEAAAQDLARAAAKRAGAAGASLAKGEVLDQLEAYRTGGLAELEQPLEEAVVWADLHKVPHNRLILDEFGAMRRLEREDGAGYEGPISEGYLEFLAGKRQSAEARGLGWAVWSWRGEMGVSPDGTSYDIGPDVCLALGLPGC